MKEESERLTGAGHEHKGHSREDKTQESLGTKLDRCAHFLYHRQHSGGRGQGKILKILSVSGPLTQKELQDRLDIQAGSMSEIAAKLEGKGLITRTRDDADKRRILLTITDEGRADVARYAEARERESELFSVLTEEEQRQLDTLLSRLLESWKGQWKRAPRKGHGHHAPEGQDGEPTE
ncbi:MAG: MarR family transcriptional regulator [Clostridiales bacterium]|nr:MarR family transcriptional regulator [Clostridiales bacterium]